LNGYPKGAKTGILRYIRHIQKKGLLHSFTCHPVAERSRIIERDDRAFPEIIAFMRSSDIAPQAFPSCFLLVPSRDKHFFELIFGKNARGVFRGRSIAL
jgi:hypothetical protein